MINIFFVFPMLDGKYNRMAKIEVVKSYLKAKCEGAYDDISYYQDLKERRSVHLNL